MKEILLTKGKVALVDDDDYEKLSKYKWYSMKIREIYYARRSVRTDKRCGCILMHRFILNTKNGFEVDHKDGNGLNNQKNNLRICTSGDNRHNYIKRKKSRSLYKGIDYDSRRKKWRARISCNYKNFHIGYFLSEIDAAKAYDKMAIKLYDEYKNLNF